MKKLIYLFMFLAFWSRSQGQSSLVRVDTNNVNALIPSTPQLFWDGVNSGQFEVPKGSGKSTIFASTPWVSAKKGTALYLAAETYRQAGTDYQSGPISTTYTNLIKWNVVKVSRNEIEAFRNDPSKWSSPPAGILNWPANGDPANGQAAKLAPFVNQGGSPDLYEPQYGDYPAIKGDVCTYYIFNDDKLHNESGGNKLKIEIHRIVYEYADTQSFVNNTVFVEYNIINRSTIDYDSTWFSVYSDYDLGNYNDDYIATDSARNMVLAYNGNSTDNTYGSNPPAEGMILLNKPLQSSMYYNNDNTNKGNPVTASEYNNYMNSRWRNGAPLTYFGGSAPTLFAFSGDVCSQSRWTEGNSSDTPGDRRILGNVYRPYFSSGEFFNVTFAYLYARGNSGPESSVCQLSSEADKLIQWYQNLPPTGVRDVNKASNILSVYPNPSNSGFNVELREKAESIEVTDLTGKVIQTYADVSGMVKIEAMPAGFYLIRVYTDQGTEVRKVIAE